MCCLLHMLAMSVSHSCENDSNIANEVVQKDIPLIVLGSLCILSDAPLHQCVLAHKDNTVLAQTLYEAAEIRSLLVKASVHSINQQKQHRKEAYPADVLELF